MPLMDTAVRQQLAAGIDPGHRPEGHRSSRSRAQTASRPSLGNGTRGSHRGGSPATAIASCGGSRTTCFLGLASAELPTSGRRNCSRGIVKVNRLEPGRTASSPPVMHNPFCSFNSSPEVIRLAVMMSVRDPVSLRQVEDRLCERGIDICHETVRDWWNRFGPLVAAEIRKRRVHHRSYSLWRWHLDEVCVRIKRDDP